MKKKLRVLSVLLSAVAVSSYGTVVAAWDFGGTAATAPGWTTFALGANNSSTVGGLTLTQAATGSWTNQTRLPVANFVYSTILLAASARAF